MSLINSSITGNFLTRHIRKVLASHLPTKFKQAFFVTSGVAMVIRNKVPSMDVLWHVNAKLRSGYRTAFMIIPAYSSERFWSGVTGILGNVCPPVVCPGCRISELSDNDLWRIGMVFATQCPDWLKYGSMQLMASDIHDTLETLGRLKSPR